MRAAACNLSTDLSLKLIDHVGLDLDGLLALCQLRVHLQVDRLDVFQLRPAQKLLIQMYAMLVNFIFTSNYFLCGFFI